MIALLFVSALPFIENDYAGAVARAKAQDEPLIVDLWATWCHSCQSMRNYVLTDPALDPLSKHALFVSLDTDKEVNAKAVAKMNPQVWPTFVALDPKDETVVAELIGSVTPEEFSAFVQRGVAAVTEKRAGKKSVLGEADRASFRGDHKTAVVDYQKALGEAETPDARARIAAALVFEMYMAKDANCFSTCMSEARRSPNVYMAESIYTTAVQCEGATMSKKDKGDIRAVLQTAVNKVNYTADDKASFYDALLDLAEHDGDKAQVTALETAELKMLEDAAAKAPTPVIAGTFDPYREHLYFALGRPDDAIKMLQASEKNSPEDFNPPARLAWAYWKKGDAQDAKVAIARAEKLVYGPRAASVYMVDADICTLAKDPAAAREKLLKAKQVLQAAPENAGTTMRIQEIDKRLSGS